MKSAFYKYNVSMAKISKKKKAHTTTHWTSCMVYTHKLPVHFVHDVSALIFMKENGDTFKGGNSVRMVPLISMEKILSF